MRVYLAGPITGQSYGGATEWRDQVIKEFDRINERLPMGMHIYGYSPMRGKAYLSKEDKVADSYADHTMSSINGINVRDFNDCKKCDALLVNLLPATRVSIGTVMEIAWARAFQIPIVIVMQPGNVHDHGMLTFGNIVVETLEEGIAAIEQILLP